MKPMPGPADSALGKPTEYGEHFDPERLFPIPRASHRSALDLAGVPLHGVDLWNAWELSWLAPRGLPQVAIAELRVPADSPHLIESKSLKLYFNGFMQQPAADADEVAARIATDLSVAAGAGVEVRLRSLDEAPAVSGLAGHCIDDPAIGIEHYGPPDSSLLAVHEDRKSVV